MQNLHDCRINIKPAACILAAISLLVFPVRWVIAWLTAAVVHELSHIIALHLCRAKIYSITIGMSGATIETETLSNGDEMISAAAGPVGGLAICFLSGIFPRLSLCALIQSTYNLLPFFPFDGGRILSCTLMELLGSRRGEAVMQAVETLSITCVLVGIFLLTFKFRLGLYPILFALLLFLRSGILKIPCKAGKQIVQ